MKRVLTISGLLIFLALAIHKIPIHNVIVSYTDIGNRIALHTDKLALNVVVLFILYSVIEMYKIKIGLHFSLSSSWFYSIVLLLILNYTVTGMPSILSNGSFGCGFHMENILLFCKTMVSAAVEEILFRGIILYLLLEWSKDHNQNIHYPIVVAALIFGLAHLMNSFDDQGKFYLANSFNQVYAAFSIGFLYCVTYLLTKNIGINIIIHGVFNYLSALESQKVSEVTGSFDGVDQYTSMEFLLLLIVFGLPILAGILLISMFREEVDDNLAMLSSRNNIE